MSSWASADAAALKKGEASDDHFGLLLLAYPVSDELKDEWARARATAAINSSRRSSSAAIS